MVICQTLWTNKKNLIENSFGWLTSQHHLMAWALSCHQLKKFYKEVNLFTDSNGEEILSDTLKLPYTNIFCVYDSLDCHPDLWAYPKLITYSKQNRPFIHVDGDVVLWKPFSNNLIQSPLIAQNLETGTDYYASLFSTFKSVAHFYPAYLKSNLFSETPRGFNAGILGGMNLDFFKLLLSEATKIIKRNTDKSLNLNFNIIFEQLLFYSLAKKEKIEVSCYFEKEYPDNGYDIETFAKFSSLYKSNYLHFIGRHKSNKEVCNWISNFVYYHYPHTFHRIISLFKERHYHFPGKIQESIDKLPQKRRNTFKYAKTVELLNCIAGKINNPTIKELSNLVNLSENDILKVLYKHENKIHGIILKYNRIATSKLAAIEKDCVNSISFFALSDNNRNEATITVNPFLEVLHSCYDWINMQIEPDALRLKSSLNKDIIIGVVPDLFYVGYKEFILDELSVNIILTIGNETTFNNLSKSANGFFANRQTDTRSLESLIVLKLEYLVANKVVFINKK